MWTRYVKCLIINTARSAAGWSLPVTQKALYTVDIVVPSPRFAAWKTRKRIYLITANEVEVEKDYPRPESIGILSLK